MSHTRSMRMSRKRRLRAVALGALAGLLASGGAAAGAQAQAPTGGVAADWLTASTTSATGKLLGSDVTLSESRVTTAEAGAVLDGRSTYFASSAFSPALPKSDMMQVFGPAAGSSTVYSYALSFRQPVTDPILHIGSLAAKLELPGTTATKRSGTIQVSATTTGTTVSSLPLSSNPSSVPPDADGTIRLSGTFGNGANGHRPITLKTSTPPWGNWASDGILIQVAAPVTCTDWLAAGASTADGTLPGRTVKITRAPSPFQLYPLSFGTQVNGSWPGFGAAFYSPVLPASDVIHMVGPRDPGVRYHYTIDIREALNGLPRVTRAILNIGSLASAIEFATPTSVTPLSREGAAFDVTPSSVRAILSSGQSDVGGSVMLSPASTIKFDILNPDRSFVQEDGIYLQVCAVA